MFQARRPILTLLLPAMCMATTSVLGAAEKLTEDKLLELEMELLDADVGEALGMLKPYLSQADSRLAPMLAEVLSRSESASPEARKSLFEALVRIADARVYESAVKMLRSQDPSMVRMGIRVIISQTIFFIIPKSC